MKTLYLVRHAKSSWAGALQKDFGRPLNERGNADKKTMGKRLVQKDEKIDLILSSSAKRTTQTTYGLNEYLGLESNKIQFTKELYHAGVSETLDIINQVEDQVNNLMLVGHNPAISILCDYLCNFVNDFPTLAMAKITFDTDTWQAISGGTGSIEWYDFPKNGARE